MKTIEVDGNAYEFTFTMENLAAMESSMGGNKPADGIKICLGMLKTPLPTPTNEDEILAQYKIGRAILVSLQERILNTKNSDAPSDSH